MRQDSGASNDDLMQTLIQALLEGAERPPKEVKGVGEEFLADLERVPKKALKEGDSCPICNIPFLEDEYPLVVRLPCHETHVFDLECITPWLKLQSTCPLDRRDLVKRKAPPPVVEKDDEEEEEEYDDMYA
jgi:hypothetical protein